MKSYRELAMEDLRLVLLRVLAEAPGYEANSFILAGAAEEFGHHVSTDLLRTELTWLAEQGLVSVKTLAAVQVASLSPRGLDVAKGNASIPGVKRPAPGG
jgi:hypothetical protein